MADSSEMIDRIKTFLKDQNEFYSKDKEDIQRSRNLQNGDGWYERYGKAFGEARSVCTINPMIKVISSTCNAFLNSPFVFQGIPDDAQQRINEVLYDCLRDACADGLAYCGMFHLEDGRIGFKQINALNVVWTEEEAVVIEKRKSSGKNPAKTTIWGDTSALALASDEYPVLYHYKKSGGKISVAQIVCDEIAKETELELPHIPIVPVRGKAITINNRTHYRGFYYQWQDPISLMNLCLSRAAEMAVSRTPVMIAEQSLGDSENVSQWTSNEQRNTYVYSAYRKEKVNGAETIVQLPQPMLAPNSIDLDTLNKQVDTLMAYIDSGTGSDLLTENKGNQTATEVLLKNRSKQDALSELLHNLNSSAHRIGRLFSAYIAQLNPGSEKPDIVVIDKMAESMKNRMAVDLLLAVSPLPPIVQLAVLETYNSPPPLVAAVRQSIEESNDPEKQQAAIQIQELNQQIAIMQSENKMAEATHAAALIEAEQRYATKMAELEIEKARLELEFHKHGIRREIDLMKLEQKDKVDTIELMQNAETEGAKIAAEIAPKES